MYTVSYEDLHKRVLLLYMIFDDPVDDQLSVLVDLIFSMLRVPYCFPFMIFG